LAGPGKPQHEQGGLNVSKLLIGVMVVAGIVMVFGLIKHKAGEAWGKPVATMAVFVALICALMQIFSGGAPSQRSVMQSQYAYMMVSTEKLGQYLAEKYPGSKALVIVAPTSTLVNQSNEALVKGLKEGMGGKVEIIKEIAPEVPKMNMPNMPTMPANADGKTPKAPPMDPVAMMGPPEFWLTPAAMDSLIEPYIGKADLVITTIGLPMDMAKMKYWTWEKKPKMVLASGGIFSLKKAIEAQAVAAAVAYNPKSTFDNLAPPSNLEEAFNKRFVLITPDNIKEISTSIPELFMSPAGPMPMRR